MSEWEASMTNKGIARWYRMVGIWERALRMGKRRRRRNGVYHRKKKNSDLGFDSLSLSKLICGDQHTTWSSSSAFMQ